jgi:hypothetical protein
VIRIEHGGTKLMAHAIAIGPAKLRAQAFEGTWRCSEMACDAFIRARRYRRLLFQPTEAITVPHQV